MTFAVKRGGLYVVGAVVGLDGDRVVARFGPARGRAWNFTTEAAAILVAEAYDGEVVDIYGPPANTWPCAKPRQLPTTVIASGDFLLADFRRTGDGQPDLRHAVWLGGEMDAFATITVFSPGDAPQVINSVGPGIDGRPTIAHLRHGN